MNKKQAQALLDQVEFELGTRAVELRPVGNGTTYAVIIHRQFWCWELSDFEKYMVTVVNYPKQKVAS